MSRPRRKRFCFPLCNLSLMWWGCAVLLVVVTGWVAFGVWQNAQPDTDDYKRLIEQYAAETSLSESLVRAVILTESGGDPAAHSHADARGLMQITPITHRDVIERFHLPQADDEALFDPEYNIAIGTQYLSYLLERFDGDPQLALAAYHMGPTHLRRLIDAHPTYNTNEILAFKGQDQVGPKTRAYVENVMERLGEDE